MIQSYEELAPMEFCTAAAQPFPSSKLSSSNLAFRPEKWACHGRKESTAYKLPTEDSANEWHL